MSLDGLLRYRRDDLVHDLLAGLTVAAVAVPTGIAYARLAGLSPASGLTASILPLLAYAAVGTSRHLVVGPSAATTALVAAAVVPLAGGDQALAQSLAAALAGLVGILCIGAAALRLGGIADFLSKPLLVGFMHGVALSIVLGQLGPLFGVTVEAGGIIPRLVELIGKLPLTHPPTLAVGLGAFAVLAGAPRVLPRVPAPLLAMIAACAVTWALGLDRFGVATIGTVPAGLPALRLPRFPPALFPELLAEAAGIALVSFSNMMLVARAFAARHRYDVDAEREVAALGAANLVAAVSQGFVVSGTNSRTAVADAAGGRTQLTGLVSAAAVALVLIAGTAPLAYVPAAALAAVLIRAALSLIDVRTLAAIRRIDRVELWLSLLATVGVVVVGAMHAILLVVALSLLRFVRLTARPAASMVDLAPPGLALFRFDGPIVFFTAPHFKREALAAAARAGDGLRWLIVDMEPVNLVDATGVLVLRDVRDALAARSIVVGLTGRREEWTARIATGDAAEALAGIPLFADPRAATDAFRAAAGTAAPRRLDARVTVAEKPAREAPWDERRCAADSQCHWVGTVRTLETVAEHGLIPRPLVRFGIRRLIAGRLRSEARVDPTVRRAALIANMRASPIALAAAQANAQHYEMPADFFRLILGPRLKYSCCLWEPGTATLAAAEDAMLARTCERAGIEDGMRVLDLGCGWGSLTRWILEQYPHTRVTAVSNSASQRELIRSDLMRRGLAGRATLVTADMNQFAPRGRFHRICSLEMFEHMRNYEALLGRIACWLEPDGRLFVHIFCHRTLAYPYEIDGDGDWMARNFFTGGLMPSFDLLPQFQRDLVLEESWRVSGTHYARTSEAWLANIDRNRDAANAVLGGVYGSRAAGRWVERWRLFFLACAELFACAGGDEWLVGHYRLRPGEAVRRIG